MSNNASFFSELRRRNVFRVALTYAVVAWLLLEIAGVFVPMLDAPEWIITAFLVILALGFVLAMFISWSFEMTPEGLKRTEDLSPDEVIPYWSRRKFARFIIGTAVIAFGLSAYQLLRPRSPVRISQTEPLSFSQSSTADSLPDNAGLRGPRSEFFVISMHNGRKRRQLRTSSRPSDSIPMTPLSCRRTRPGQRRRKRFGTCGKMFSPRLDS